MNITLNVSCSSFRSVSMYEVHGSSHTGINEICKKADKSDCQLNTERSSPLRDKPTVEEEPRCASLGSN
jgi:hypothetical protein